MKKIVQNGDQTLREIAKEILVSDISKPKIQNLIKEMFISLARESDGVALAAPQIGVSLRIFVISPIVFAKYSEQKTRLVFINPKITSRSKDKKLLEEGCLSVRNWYGNIRRSTRIAIEAYDEFGKKFKMSGTGLLAQIFQHETDHLDGILFIDNAKNLKEIFRPNSNE
jgi:peptide deformylase